MSRMQVFQVLIYQTCNKQTLQTHELFKCANLRLILILLCSTEYLRILDCFHSFFWYVI